jgi:hypothetical protein
VFAPDENGLRLGGYQLLGSYFEFNQFGFDLDQFDFHFRELGTCFFLIHDRLYFG